MDILEVLFLLFFAGSIIYTIFLRPKFEEDRHNLKFDNSVLGTFDGLCLAGHEAGIKFGCADSELRNYIELQLSKQRRLPGNQILIEYTTKRGWYYSSHTDPNDHMLFALLCIAQYAKEHDHSELVSWCESMMQDAHIRGAHFVS